MSDTTVKTLPESIRHAMAALDILRTEDPDLAMQLEKILPSYAMRLSQRGDDVSLESLLQVARQGVAKLKGAFTTAQTTPRSLLERYQDIVGASHPKEVDSPSLAEITHLLDNGLDIHANNDKALRKAAGIGQTDAVRLLLDRGANIHALNDGALQDAAAAGHVETVRLLLDRGANIHANEDRALENAAAHGHIETVRLLLDRGANIHADHDRALTEAAAYGDNETVRLLLDRGADIHARVDRALHCAARAGHTATVSFLLDRGAHIHANNDEALRKAAENGHHETVRLLLDRGAVAATLTELQSLALDAHARNVARWQKAVRTNPPALLDGCDATVFKPALFKDLVAILKLEGYSNRVVLHPFAYTAMALLQNETRVLHYLQKWGSGEQPLHDLIQMVRMPLVDLSGVNLVAWGDAMLQHGPKMAQLASFSHRVPTPIRAPDNKSWSYALTRAEAAQFSYERGYQNPQLAAFCFELLVPEENFNTALQLTKRKPHKKDMPDITIAGDRFGMAGAAFKKLANDDIRGLFLGNLTDCCQSIGGAGNDCAEHGFTSKNGGFYVVETAQGEIIGQSWAWRGDKGELCFDSLETLGKRISAQQWRTLLDETAKELTTRQDHTVTALHVGMGGKTPKSLSKHFTAKAAKPIDYKDYRDSKAQVRVWKR